MTSPKPSDSYFKLAFSHRVIARELIEYIFPPEAFKLLDIKALQLSPDSFVDSRLCKSLADMVYSCTLKNGRPIRICFLLEHKSRAPGRKIYPQLLRYLVNIMEYDIRQQRTEFTLTIPIIFYHGEKPWDLLDLSQYYGDVPKRYAQYIPSFQFMTVNLQRMTRVEIQSIRRDWALRNVFLTMKQAWDDAFFEQNFQEIIIFADRNLKTEEEEMLFEATFLYIQKISNKSKEEIMEITTQLPRKYKKRKMSAYDQIVQEGILKGIEKGRVEGMEKGRVEGIEKGRVEGMEKGMETLILKYSLKFPNKTPQEIAELFEIPVDFVIRTLTKK